MTPQQAYDWLAAKLSTEERKALDVVFSAFQERELYEAAIATLVADSGDGALIADLKRDRFALARRFRSVTRAKLNAQAQS